MSTANLGTVSSKGGANLPSSISYQIEEEDYVDRKSNRCWNFFRSPLQKIGQVLRNAFYLPLYNKKVDHAFELNQRLADNISAALKNANVLCPKDVEVIRRNFSVYDIPVELKGGSVSRIFTVRLFESKQLIQGKKVRIVLFSFYGNLEVKNGESKKWEPLTIRELSESPLLVMRAIETLGLKVHSLVTTSLGNVALDGLRYAQARRGDQEAIPSKLIINRGLSSVQKVARQLYSFPLSTILYGAAKLSGWDADPESELLKFFERSPKDLNEQRKVVIIEAQKDFYFSENGRMELDAHEKIAQTGVSVFRASYFPFYFHTRSHHAMGLDHFIHNSATEVVMNKIPLSTEINKKISSVLVRDIFLSGDKEDHTCFYVCGNNGTLAIATVGEAIPLLSALLEEGAKAEQGKTDDRKEPIAS